MPLPPSTIELRRKRKDRPEELLMIEKEGNHKHQRLIDTSFVFRRVPTAETPDRHNSKQNTGQSQLAKTDSSLNDESATPRSIHNHKIIDGLNTEDRNSSDARTALEQKPALLGPRRFHLISRSSSPSRQRASVHHSISKSKRARAIFTESRRSHLERFLDQANFDRDGKTGSQAGASKPERPLKRPNASSAEREWRSRNWATKSDISRKNPAIGPNTMEAAPHDPQQLQLAAELQQWTLQEMDLSGDDKLRPVLRYQPKPPPARYYHRHSELDQTPSDNGSCDKLIKEDLYGDMPQPTCLGTESHGETWQTDEDGEEWVYDTYAREPIPMANVAASDMRTKVRGASQDISDLGTGPTTESTERNDASFAVFSTAATSEHVGILVIRAEDERIWRFFEEEDGGDDSEEDHVNSDDEDSNAEDHYANDYPDEESSGGTDELHYSEEDYLDDNSQEDRDD